MSEPLERARDRNGAFPRLDDEQRARLRAVGELRTVAAGEVLFREGDDGYDFFVVESGAVAIVRGYGDENRVIAVHGAAPLPRRAQPADRRPRVPDAPSCATRAR